MNPHIAFLPDASQACMAGYTSLGPRLVWLGCPVQLEVEEVASTSNTSTPKALVDIGRAPSPTPQHSSIHTVYLQRSSWNARAGNTHPSFVYEGGETQCGCTSTLTTVGKGMGRVEAESECTTNLWLRVHYQPQSEGFAHSLRINKARWRDGGQPLTLPGSPASPAISCVLGGVSTRGAKECLIIEGSRSGRLEFNMIYSIVRNYIYSTLTLVCCTSLPALLVVASCQCDSEQGLFIAESCRPLSVPQCISASRCVCQ